MRREHQRLAVAVDEHGTLSGMVTFEDLVEELVGEVFSEHEQDRQLVTKLADGSVSVRGDLPLRELNRELGIELEAPDGVATVAGLCMKLAGGIPNRGRPPGGQRRHRAGGAGRDGADGAAGAGDRAAARPS